MNGVINNSMSDDTKDDKEPLTFQDLGMELQWSEASQLQIGQQYPMMGAITKILSEDLADVKVEVNHNIEISLNVASAENLDMLKRKSFETGIFITEITELDLDNPDPKAYKIKGRANAIIFGRSPNPMQ